MGVAQDGYHVWWDPRLQYQIHRAGKERWMAYHVCDCLTPTRDLLNDRGMMGDGIIEFRKIRGCVEEAGYNRYCEVDIFSELDWWQWPGADVLQTCIDRHKTHV